MIVEAEFKRALAEGLPGEPLYGLTPLAGLPKGWAEQTCLAVSQRIHD